MTKKREKLKALRKEQNLTQAQLADKVGVSFEQIRSLEYGRVNPSFSVMTKICSIFNSKAEDIF